MVSVRYPPGAARALAHLRGSGNDIEVYVEDSANPNVWLYYVRQHLPNGKSLRNVNILGSRSQVIAACKLDQNDRAEKRLYLIDGDIDILLGRPKPRLKHLYRLPAYCIENMLLEENALIPVATTSDVTISEDEARARLSFSDFETAAKSTLVPLFYIYATLMSLGVPEKTVSLAVGGLLNNGKRRVSLCPNKSFRRSMHLLRRARDHLSAAAVRTELHRVKAQASAFDLTYKEMVSAKDYSLQLIYINLCKLFGYRGTYEQLKVQLAQQPTVRSDPNLRRRLTIALK